MPEYPARLSLTEWGILPQNYLEGESKRARARELTLTREREKVMSNKVHYWSDIANLTHETQVEEFGFCTCEEQEYFPYDDCPRESESK